MSFFGVSRTGSESDQLEFDFDGYEDPYIVQVVNQKGRWNYLVRYAKDRIVIKFPPETSPFIGAFFIAIFTESLHKAIYKNYIMYIFIPVYY